MIFLGPIILLLGIWWLHVIELRKENPQPNFILFYKVISLTFALILMFVLPFGITSIVQMILAWIVMILAFAVIIAINLPEDRLPTWYKEKFHIPNRVTEYEENDSGGEDNSSQLGEETPTSKR